MNIQLGDYNKQEIWRCNENSKRKMLEFYSCFKTQKKFLKEDGTIHIVNIVGFIKDNQRQYSKMLQEGTLSTTFIHILHI